MVTDVYLVKDIYDFSPEFFYGCRNVLRNIITKKKIPSEDILWAYFMNQEWKVCDRNYKKAKLFIFQEWVYDNVPKFARNSTIIESIQRAPPILQLEDDELWIDENGDKYPIEIRGERTVNGIFFRAKDVAEVFGMDRLNDTLTDNRYGYKKNHYCNFILTKPVKHGFHKNKKELFLTYFGLVRVLMVSRHKQVEKFQQWAINILFTHQFGNKNKNVSQN